MLNKAFLQNTGDMYVLASKLYYEKLKLAKVTFIYF